VLVLGFLCCFVFVCERPEDGFACHSARAEVVFSPAGPFEDRGPVVVAPEEFWDCTGGCPGCLSPAIPAPSLSMKSSITSRQHPSAPSNSLLLTLGKEDFNLEA